MPPVNVGKRLLAGLQITRDFVARNNGNTEHLDTLIEKVKAVEPAAKPKLKISVTEVVEIMKAELGERVVTEVDQSVYIRAVGILRRSELDADQVTALVRWVGRQKRLKGGKTILDILSLAPRYLTIAMQEHTAAVAPKFTMLSEED